jgi:hypothetical protein
MARSLDKSTLLKEWQSRPKDWYSIYQWPPTSKCGYTEWISEWIKESLGEIRLVTDGLRQRTFRCGDHTGQIKLQTGIEQITEKRMLRAMFNQVEVPVLGKVLDYEVPLKETDDAEHGDIDLLCVQSDEALCVEAKKPGASESILKAILQAFVYTSLVATCRDRFLTDFGLQTTCSLTPAVLTFATAPSGRQLKRHAALPNLLSLIRLINSKLEEGRIAPLRFFVIENEDADLARCLTTSAHPTGGVKAIFRSGFALRIVEVKVL